MIQKPKGTNDLLDREAEKYIYIQTIFQNIMDKYNYKFMRTPIFEKEEVFLKPLGDTSDIVTKETYTFQDRGNRAMTLRPEGTAGVVRSYIENKLNYNGIDPYKTWYIGPMFRYERPQAGRTREFYQIGIEIFKSDSYLLDLEVMTIMNNFYNILGLENVVVKINCIGSLEDRNNYKDALKNFLITNFDNLSEDSKIRFEKNPLRILDSKDKKDQSILINAPKISEYINKKSLEIFEEIKTGLELLGINYVIDEKLVRGLDYYNDLVFEFQIIEEEMNNENILGGGGRYDKLVETLGGDQVPAVGCAIGVERLLLALDKFNIEIPSNKPDIYVFALSEAEKLYAYQIVEFLRMSGFKTEFDYNNKNIKNNFKYSEKIEAKYNILIGAEEIQNNELTVKNNSTKEEVKIKEELLLSYLDENIGEQND